MAYEKSEQALLQPIRGDPILNVASDFSETLAARLEHEFADSLAQRRRMPEKIGGCRGLAGIALSLLHDQSCPALVLIFAIPPLSSCSLNPWHLNRSAGIYPSSDKEDRIHPAYPATLAKNS